jgi:osmotically-inducible protein OsmY
VRTAAAGRGPRGYVRSPARIHEDLCDRLTDNPFVDASNIEVGIVGTEVTLNGTVNDPIALRQAQAIAEEVAGVTHVHNRLQLRPAGEREMTPGDVVNPALGTGRR